jgi:hypothetical protein
VSGAAASAGAARSVLVVGIYLVDREHNAVEIVRELGRSRRWQVEQRWVALGKSTIPDLLASVTAWQAEGPRPKFGLLNELLSRFFDRGRHAYVLVCDDDVTMPAAFLDRYLDLVERHDLALAQPARTHDSYTDHAIVEQLEGLDARATRFVEIGPVFSMRQDVLPLLVPFDVASPMGWGYDYVWPVQIERAGRRMGIVDATPVGHTLRKPAAHYSHREHLRAMKAFLAARPHLTRDEAFTILEAYS